MSWLTTLFFCIVVSSVVHSSDADELNNQQFTAIAYQPAALTRPAQPQTLYGPITQNYWHTSAHQMYTHRHHYRYFPYCTHPAIHMEHATQAAQSASLPRRPITSTLSPGRPASLASFCSPSNENFTLSVSDHLYPDAPFAKSVNDKKNDVFFAGSYDKNHSFWIMIKADGMHHCFQQALADFQEAAPSGKKWPGIRNLITRVFDQMGYDIDPKNSWRPNSETLKPTQTNSAKKLSWYWRQQQCCFEIGQLGTEPDEWLFASTGSVHMISVRVNDPTTQTAHAMVDSLQKKWKRGRLNPAISLHIVPLPQHTPTWPLGDPHIVAHFGDNKFTFSIENGTPRSADPYTQGNALIFGCPYYPDQTFWCVIESSQPLTALYDKAISFLKKSYCDKSSSYRVADLWNTATLSIGYQNRSQMWEASLHRQVWDPMRNSGKFLHIHWSNSNGQPHALDIDPWNLKNCWLIACPGRQNAIVFIMRQRHILTHMPPCIDQLLSQHKKASATQICIVREVFQDDVVLPKITAAHQQK